MVIRMSRDKWDELLLVAAGNYSPGTVLANGSPESAVGNNSPGTVLANGSPESAVGNNSPGTVLANKSPESAIGNNSSESAIGRSIVLDAFTTVIFYDNLSDMESHMGVDGNTVTFQRSGDHASGVAATRTIPSPPVTTPRIDYQIPEHNSIPRDYPEHHIIPPDYFKNATPAAPLTESQMITLVLAKRTLSSSGENEKTGLIRIPAELLDLNGSYVTTVEYPTHYRQRYLGPDEPVVIIRMPRDMFDRFITTAGGNGLELPASSFSRSYDNLTDMESHMQIEGNTVGFLKSEDDSGRSL